MFPSTVGPVGPLPRRQVSLHAPQEARRARQQRAVRHHAAAWTRLEESDPSNIFFFCLVSGKQRDPFFLPGLWKTKRPRKSKINKRELILEKWRGGEFLVREFCGEWRNGATRKTGLPVFGSPAKSDKLLVGQIRILPLNTKRLKS